jgi:DNA-binding PucR family transcriptional regulator
MPDALAAARRCLTALLALGRRGVVGSSEVLGVYRFLLAPGGPEEAVEFVRRTVGPLLDHDAARGTELGRTLEAYLASGRQHSATAEQLHIHPNTLYQRLTRIGAVLGEDWREPDSALDLHVALRLHRLAGDL